MRLVDKVDKVQAQYRRGLLTDVEYQLTLELILAESSLDDAAEADLERVSHYA